MSIATLTLHPPRPILRLARSPKGILLGIFAILALLAVPTVGGNEVVRNLIVATTVAVAVDLCVSVWRRHERSFPDGAILTGVIVAFLLRPQEPASTIALAVAVGLASKHLLRTRWSNVLNPAAVALVFSGALLGAGESWWGALPDLGLWGALAVLGTGVFIADRINKLPMVLVFLGAYYTLFTIAALFGGESAEVAGIFRTPDVHAALFFALFMLDDPPTSPVRYEDQVVYGVIVATLAYLLLMEAGVVYYLPLALLAGNVWESGRRVYADRARKRAATSVTSP
jgi:Na+-translocating ferredoxin:NAD+ oxidoreductase RnfD subunit